MLKIKSCHGSNSLSGNLLHTAVDETAFPLHY